MIVGMLENRESVGKHQIMKLVYSRQAHNNLNHQSLNTFEITTNNTNKTQAYNIDNDNGNMNEPFEHRKPTISERLNHIHISLDQVNNQMKDHPMAQTTNDDVDMLKSRVDNIEFTLEKQQTN